MNNEQTMCRNIDNECTYSATFKIMCRNMDNKKIICRNMNN